MGTSKTMTNEEYLELWEQSAPEAVDSKMTPEQITQAQGTRLNEKAPWETYGEELAAEDPAMLEAIAEYASRVSDAAPSNQTQEELARFKEMNDATNEQYRWVRPEEYKNEGARVGTIKHAASFIVALRAAGVKCWYRQHPQAGKLTLVIQVGDMPAEVGCWVQAGYMPELTIMRFDDNGIPTTEKYRGWRTALLQLILKGVITEKQAEETFGKTPTTPAFHRYNSTLQRFRNAGSRLED